VSRQCLGGAELVLASIPAADGAAADSVSELPDFLMASDAVEALEQPMQQLQAWRENELERNGSRDALVREEPGRR
jgi:hypothetical protein